MSEDSVVGTENLNARLASMCKRLADKTALIDPTGSWTFGELWRLSLAASKLLSAATNAANVGIMLPAVKEFAPIYFGALLAGKCVVPINFLLTVTEMKAVVADADIDCIITSRALLERLPNRQAGLPTDQAGKPKPGLPFIFIEDVAENMMVVARAEPSVEMIARAMALPSDTPATIIYTAGTSGEPKGVVLSHRNLLTNTDSCVEALQLDENFTLLASLPFFHVFGLATGLVMPISFGATAVMLPKFSVRALIGMVKQHRVSIILTVPSMWSALLASGALNCEQADSLRICVSGGEPLSQQTADAFAEAMGFALLDGYGMTETSPVISFARPDSIKPASVGKPLPGVEVRVVDADGNPMKPGDEGELQVRGPNVMMGYHKRPDLTEQAITPEGWFKTGDRGRFDEEGFLYVTGRQKELIITGGENVSPREVEDVLTTHPEIIEVAVVGVPDSSRGELVVAYVVRAEGSNLTDADIKSFCRKNLASFKTPRLVHFIDELPRNYAGKVLKRKLLS